MINRRDLLSLIVMVLVASMAALSVLFVGGLWMRFAPTLMQAHPGAGIASVCLSWGLLVGLIEVLCELAAAWVKR